MPNLLLNPKYLRNFAPNSGFYGHTTDLQPQANYHHQSG